MPGERKDTHSSISSHVLTEHEQARPTAFLARSKTVGSRSSYFPKPAGWFGDFSEAESTFNDNGIGAKINEFPEKKVEYGWDPAEYKAPFGPDWVEHGEWYDESRSDNYHRAWQTNYPPVPHGLPGSVNVDTHEGKWRDTPEGWIQNWYPPNNLGRDGPEPAPWFNAQVDQYDGFGRFMMPQPGTGQSYLQPFFSDGQMILGWYERAVNTTLTCQDPGCIARSNLQVYDPFSELASNCRLTIGVHATDFDDDWSVERYNYWRANEYILTRDCYPGPRKDGCNASAADPLYNCVLDNPVDKIIDENGTLVLEGKITDMVDECPYNSDLLSAVAVVTCMVQPITTTTTTTTTTKHVFGVEPEGECLHLKCDTAGCTARNEFIFDPTIALNGGKCHMSVNISQTDFDNLDHNYEAIEFLKVGGATGRNLLSAPVKPGQNPCFALWMDHPDPAPHDYALVTNVDVTDLIKKSLPAPGYLDISAKISKQVDECGKEDKWLLHGRACLNCVAS